jgi:hypothetical protein
VTRGGHPSRHTLEFKLIARRESNGGASALPPRYVVVMNDRSDEETTEPLIGSFAANFALEVIRV